MRPYYEENGIVIYNSDCREILPQLERVDTILTDPPYEAEAHTKGRRGNTARDGNAAFSATRAIDFSPMNAEFRLHVGSEMARLSKGWILVFCQVEAAMLWKDALQPARYSRTQIWRKPNGACQFTGDRPGMGYESIVTCWAGGGRSEWNGGGRHGVYVHNVDRHAYHQTAKPIDLIRELVSLFSDPGELILDPFGGSGTTAVAAKNLGRRCILIEKEERYCAVAVQRLAQSVMQFAEVH